MTSKSFIWSVHRKGNFCVKIQFLKCSAKVQSLGVLSRQSSVTEQVPLKSTDTWPHLATVGHDRGGSKFKTPEFDIAGHIFLR